MAHIHTHPNVSVIIHDCGEGEIKTSNESIAAPDAQELLELLPAIPDISSNRYWNTFKQGEEYLFFDKKDCWAIGRVTKGPRYDLHLNLCIEIDGIRVTGERKIRWYMHPETKIYRQFTEHEKSIKARPTSREATTQSTKSNDMNLSTLAKKMFDAETKTLIKAGLLNSNLELTSEGRDELNAILFLENKKALVERAKDIIKDRKDDKECC